MRPGKDIQALDDIYEMIWQDTEKAMDMALKAYKKYNTPRLNYPFAKIQTLVFILHQVVTKVPKQTIDPIRLKKYFQKNGYDSDAALILLWTIRSLVAKRRHDEAIQCDQEYEEKYAAAAGAIHQAERILTTGQYRLMRDLNKANQVEQALQAENLLRAHPEQTAYYRITLSSVLQFKAEALSHTGDIASAQRAINEAVQLVDTPGTSPYHSFVCHYFKGNVAAIAGKNEDALQSYLLLAEKYGGNAFYDRLLMYVYIQIFKMLNEQWAKATAANKPALVAGQKKYLALAQSLLHTQARPYIIHYLYLTEARLKRVLGEYDSAISLLAKSLRHFDSIQYTNHVIDIYEEAYLNYRDRAEKTQLPRHYHKAMHTLVKVNNLHHKYNQAQGKEKMEALINKYELQQKELNEKLLHQKMDAMNKEMQMTALNLQEKVMVLDELKGYVTSLKKKGKETNELIRTISRKIDSVIITEQDKSTLQQKISAAGSDFMSILSDRYPHLSMLEIRMCTLLKTGMTNKELSKIYGQSEKSYEQHRYRIKKKMGLGRDEKLVRVLNKLTAPKD
ncbi:MAG: hypothetical protein JST83_12715 [Bacteroidetes bacterium]|nr:hypothetical protein [Bacteroidota bacterium]